MKQKIEVEVKMHDKEKVQELMEGTLVQIIIDRINEFPEKNKVYIYDEILERLKKSF
ncbi:hypothetical protein [Tepidibacter hydrothermalis]|uniref:Uncharacterized protein n=1 Tax=Tepidibacter hydrothermalis TaxID=3036126 RepID=A0ABY8EHG7_9FIRM|nr:hypothetical protein [Tepidibacter hydrothermalis]WFD11029.1 hypothetical protein P4S50_02845 [Tepidibacter hydrothermalis]